MFTLTNKLAPPSPPPWSRGLNRPSLSINKPTEIDAPRRCLNVILPKVRVVSSTGQGLLTFVNRFSRVSGLGCDFLTFFFFFSECGG